MHLPQTAPKCQARGFWFVLKREFLTVNERDVLPTVGDPRWGGFNRRKTATEWLFFCLHGCFQASLMQPYKQKTGLSSGFSSC